MTPDSSDPPGAKIGKALEDARRRLASRAPRRAVATLEAALADVEGGAGSDAASLDVLAQLLIESYARLDDADGRARAAERCYAAGSRSVTTLSIVAAHRALIEKRTDPDALASYLDALEAGVRLDAALKERLNQILAFALHIDLSSSPADVATRVPHLRRLIVLRPRLAYPRFYLGRALYLAGDFEGAVRELLGVCGRLAAGPKLLNLLGRSLEKLGRFREAIAVYRRSLEGDRGQAAIHFRLGRVLLATAGDGAA